MQQDSLLVHFIQNWNLKNFDFNNFKDQDQFILKQIQKDFQSDFWDLFQTFDLLARVVGSNQYSKQLKRFLRIYSLHALSLFTSLD